VFDDRNGQKEGRRGATASGYRLFVCPYEIAIIDFGQFGKKDETLVAM
jgi:hypothetical protein